VVGTLLDLIEVDPGWEAAVEAACGEALTAVVVGSVEAGRAAVDILAQGDISSAVLALEAARPTAARAAAAAGEPVRAHVHARRPEVDALLDTLIGSAVVVEGGWAAAIDAALAHPDAVVVTREGGRFAPAGWRAVTATTGATGAALDEATEKAEVATEAAEAAEEARRQAVADRSAARTADDTTRRALDEHGRQLAAAVERRARAVGDRDEARAEAANVTGQLDDAVEGVERERERVAELEAMLPELEAEEAETEQRAEAMRTARRQLDQRRDEVHERASRSSEAWHAAQERRVELDRTHTTLERLVVFVDERQGTIKSQLVELQEKRRKQTDLHRAVLARLDALRKERLESERKLEGRRERDRRAELEEAEVRMRLEQATEMCRTQLDIEPHAAINAPQPELPDGVPAAARVRELERELKLLGPINPLALEEFDALQERHGFLQEQLDDVKGSRRELSKVIRAVDDEIVRIFAAAFADVSENFTQLFSTLFPGGEGGLRLTNPDDLLNCGIEIEAKPSGKNVKKLSLLSGGERSLTALAFLFAVFRSRPSPFYVMDEVEAALDDVNLHRFLDLITEFRQEAQLVVVSHQKRTMEAADCLYGVTMQPGGSSRVVSETVTTASAHAATA
jgi:chromosome segregation protein